MISKINKFPMRTQFVRLRARAKRLVSPHLTAYFLASPRPSRLSVVVPAKVSKLAVTRNSYKRLGFDTVWPQILDKKLDCVIIFKPLPLPKSPANRNLIVSEINSLEIK